MNQRILELARESGAWDYFDCGGKSEIMDHQTLVNFAHAVLREAVSKMEVDGADFYYNEYNDYGCITVNYFVPGIPNSMMGEEILGEFPDGTRGTGRFRLNEEFVLYLLDKIKPRENSSK